MRLTVAKAIRIGELLSIQKEKCAHGAWIPWIKANLTFDRKMAVRYMSCFRNRERLNVSSTRHLTIEDLAHHSEPESKREPEQTKAEPEVEREHESEPEHEPDRQKADTPSETMRPAKKAVKSQKKSPSLVAEPEPVKFIMLFSSNWDKLVGNYSHEQQGQLAKGVIEFLVAQYPELKPE